MDCYAQGALRRARYRLGMVEYGKAKRSEPREAQEALVSVLYETFRRLPER